jgi:hypothetical protein
MSQVSIEMSAEPNTTNPVKIVAFVLFVVLVIVVIGAFLYISSPPEIAKNINATVPQTAMPSDSVQLAHGGAEQQSSLRVEAAQTGLVGNSDAEFGQQGTHEMEIDSWPLPTATSPQPQPIDIRPDDSPSSQHTQPEQLPVDFWPDESSSSQPPGWRGKFFNVNDSSTLQLKTFKRQDTETDGNCFLYAVGYAFYGQEFDNLHTDTKKMETLAEIRKRYKLTEKSASIGSDALRAEMLHALLTEPPGMTNNENLLRLARMQISADKYLKHVDLVTEDMLENSVYPSSMDMLIKHIAKDRFWNDGSISGRILASVLGVNIMFVNRSTVFDEKKQTHQDFLSAHMIWNPKNENTAHFVIVEQLGRSHYAFYQEKGVSKFNVRESALQATFNRLFEELKSEFPNLMMVKDGERKWYEYERET